ncbi:hypothetical protein TNCV_4636621 [Trichonephila clavipes]|nr:hypothetical protein TNCV_4636621 [Trichonephila clavipes]
MATRTDPSESQSPFTSRREQSESVSSALFPAGYSQRDAPYWQPGVKASLCKTAVYVYLEIILADPQQGEEYTEEPFPAYVVVRLMLSNDPVQMSMLCGELGRPSWVEYPLFGIDSITGRSLSVSRFRNRLNDYEKSFLLPVDCDRGSRVVYVSDHGLLCHEFEPSTTKDPPCRAAMPIKSVES